jgi:hypothetical protein
MLGLLFIPFFVFVLLWGFAAPNERVPCKWPEPRKRSVPSNLPGPSHSLVWSILMVLFGLIATVVHFVK